MAEPMDVAVGTMTSSWGPALAKYGWVFAAVIGLIIIGGIVFLVAYSVKTRAKWNLTFRIRQEDKRHGTIYLDPTVIKGKRITLSNGLRLIYLEKPILGKKLIPNLNHYTRPGVYDLIISADNRIFLIDGIEGIDEQRKLLKVGIRYPGIDYSLDEVNRDHAKLNKADRKSDLLGIVKAASIAVVAIVILLVVIVGGKYWLDAKEIDASISESEIRLYQGLETYQEAQVEQTNAMMLLVDKMKDLLDTDDLRHEIKTAGEGG